jgi:hypothetical protein
MSNAGQGGKHPKRRCRLYATCTLAAAVAACSCNKGEAQNTVCLLAEDALEYAGIHVAHDLAAVRGGPWNKVWRLALTRVSGCCL